MKVGTDPEVMPMASSALFICCAAARIDAQAAAGLIRERPGVGLGVGFTNNGDENSGDRTSVDVSVHLDVPLDTTWRLRAEAGTARWLFTPMIPVGSNNASRVRLTRLTAGLVHSIVPKRQSSRLGIDAAGGVGLYHYGLPPDARGAASRVGVHGGVGFDYALRNSRGALGADADARAPRPWRAIP